MSGALKVATFTVQANAEQSARWKQAAEATGHRSVGTWLAEAADAHMKARARAGIPVPLAWHVGHFEVVFDDGRTVTMRGKASPPFGIYRGDHEGKRAYVGGKVNSLVYLPSGKVIATLRTSAQARTLAAELAPVYGRDDGAAVGIVERYRREAL